MTIPTYSLLERHEDTVVYRVPDPTGSTPAWVRIGLFPWELEGVPLPEMLELPSEEHAEAAVDYDEGVGFRVGFHGPTSYHPTPIGFEDRVKDVFECNSHGSGQDGRMFRVEDASPPELRQMGRWVALYGFAYWWWIETHTDYPIGKRGTREQNRRPRLAHVDEDGTVTTRSGEEYTSPYTLDEMELLSPDEWATPFETATEEIQRVVDDLRNDVPAMTITKALREAEDGLLDPVESTKEKQEHDRLVSTLKAGDGIGHTLRSSICRSFDTVEELCDDIRAGGKQLRSVRGVGEGREDALIDALIESGEWTAEEAE